MVFTTKKHANLGVETSIFYTKKTKVYGKKPSNIMCKIYSGFEDEFHPILSVKFHLLYMIVFQ